MTLPQDNVNYTKISWVDSAGIKHLMYPTSKTSNPSSNPLQDSAGDYTLAATGTLVDTDATIVLDADRADIYNDTYTESYFSEMRSYTMQEASSNGITVVDMDPIFRDDYARNGEKFEFPTDGHWNEHAHQLVSKALIKNIDILQF